MQRTEFAWLAFVAAALAGCAPLATSERPSPSSLGCMRAAMADLDPSGLSDAHIHCIAAARIAQRCSTGEAWIASIGKEIKDVFGPGDAEWRDLDADRRGIRCARAGPSSGEALLACCESGNSDGSPRDLVTPAEAEAHLASPARLPLPRE